MNKEIKGLIVFYINVGQIPTEKAEEFVELHKEKIKNIIEKLENTGWNLIFLPTRIGETRIEKIEL